MHKKTETAFHKILHTLEFIIAMLTLIVLIGMLGLEIYRMFKGQQISFPMRFFNPARI